MTPSPRGQCPPDRRLHVLVTKVRRAPKSRRPSVRRVKTEHAYRSSLSWRGSTGAGYDSYDRTHRVRVPPAAAEFELSSDPAFVGNADLANPEQLLLAAARSCQLLSFLAYAARSRIDIVAYEDEAEAIMLENDPPLRITRIVLRPRVIVASGDHERVGRLIDKAHDACFIANTLNAEMVIEPTIEDA
jgi:organic hydroperoxide reductase OsmC/OhrA